MIVDAPDPYPGCLRLSDVLEDGDAPELEARLATARRRGSVPDDPFTILYTSGTTSFPKGAVITHRNCVPHGWFCGHVLRLTPEDRVLHALPLSGTWGGLCIPLADAGATAPPSCSWRASTPRLALHLMERERITVWNAVDAMAIAVLEHPDLARRDRSSLRTGGFGMTGGGAHGLFEAIVERIGVPLAYQPYGMTEVNALSLYHCTPPRSLLELCGVAGALVWGLHRGGGGSILGRRYGTWLQARWASFGLRGGGGYRRRPQEARGDGARLHRGRSVEASAILGCATRREGRSSAPGSGRRSG